SLTPAGNSMAFLFVSVGLAPSDLCLPSNRIRLNSGCLVPKCTLEPRFPRFCRLRRSPTMRIDNDPKLDFDDVLIRPKRSEAPSRATIALQREYRFLNSGATWKGI